MKELKLKAIVLSEFKGEINSHIMTNEDVYYTVQNILEFVVITQLPFTKWQDFIADLIKAFEDLKSSGINDDYNYAESKVIEASAEITNVDSLKNAFAHLVEVQHYPEFKDIYNKLKNNYYTS